MEKIVMGDFGIARQRNRRRAMCLIGPFALLLGAFSAPADTVTIPETQTFQFTQGPFSFVSSFGEVLADGTVEDFSFGGDSLIGPWTFGCCGKAVNLPAGSTIEDATLVVNSVSAQAISTAPGMYIVSGSAKLNGAVMFAFDEGNSCPASQSPTTTVLPQPSIIGQSYPFALPCATTTDFALQDVFSGTASLFGFAAHYPSYDPYQMPGYGFSFFEMNGTLDITINDTIRIDYANPVPEPHGIAYLGLGATLLLIRRALVGKGSSRRAARS